MPKNRPRCRCGGDTERNGKPAKWRCKACGAPVQALPHNENYADHETGRPALYDNAIDTNYTHSIGTQKGQI